jgi:hypothetical protein
VIATLTLVAGPALALFNAALANPVQAAVMPSATTPAARDLASVVTVSTVLPAVGLFVPLLLIGAALYVWAGTAAIRSQPRPVLFVIPGSSIFGRASAAIRSITVPEEYRSILSLRQLEVAAASASPVLWLAAVVALAFAVSR